MPPSVRSPGKGPSQPRAGSFEEVFSESDFAPLLWKRIVPLVSMAQEAATSRRAGEPIAKRDVSAIHDAAHDVETFLDDHGARGNHTFAPLVELVACIRGFAQIDYTAQHLAVRFDSYVGEERTALDEEFLKDLQATIVYADASLRRLTGAMVEDVLAIVGRRRLGTRRPPPDPAPSTPRFRLPHDIDDVPGRAEEDKIAELGTLYLTHKRTLDKVSDGRRFDDAAAMRRFVLEVSDEEQCRYFEARIHNLQSKYDTFVKGTDLERRDEDLKRFRGVVSVTLHLVECLTQLVHFYERHENDVRADDGKDRIASLVDKDRLLDRALNFCLHFAHAYLDAGAPIAERLIARYTKQRRLALDLPDGVTIHIRPASLIAAIVKHHATPVTVTIGSDTRYAGSVLDILMAAGANAGDRQFTFEGDARPLDDIRLLFESRLGEDGFANFPEQLSYLRPGS